MAKVPSRAAIDCAERLRGILSVMPSAYPDRAAYDRAVLGLAAVITTDGGSYSEKWDGARVSLHGLSATSTSGLAAAARNWCAQVTLKAAQASMAGVK